jgi:crotonobetainyl-CoA:carnitine CoA-transferase CaiB-like acyl-CoA transferase
VVGDAVPLEGVVVLDLTRFVSGSYVTLVLSALGADVVKIEVPPDGDPYRRQGAARLGDESVLFMTLNSGKRSAALDFRRPESREAVIALLHRADVVVENARPGSLAHYGLDFESVHERHPRIVYGSISGFGDVGPLAGRGGFDLTLQAASGLMSVTGHSDTGPAKVGAPVLDVGSGLACVVGILAALGERNRTARGRHVTTSLLEFSLSSLSTLVTEYFVSGEVPGLLGTHSPTFAPYGCFRAADGWLAFAGAGSDELWVRACTVLGREDLVDDPLYRDNGARVRHRDELTATIEKTTLTRPVDEWLDRFDAAGVPAERINDLPRALHSSQVEALEVIQQLEHPSMGAYRTVGIPVRIDGIRPRLPRSSPRLGQHTRDVLAEAGLSVQEIDALVAGGVAVEAT